MWPNLEFSGIWSHLVIRRRGLQPVPYVNGNQLFSGVGDASPSGIIPRTLVYNRFCLEDQVFWLMSVLVSDTQKRHSGPWKAAETHFQRKKHWKYIVIWSAFLVDNVLG